MTDTETRYDFTVHYVTGEIETFDNATDVETSGDRIAVSNDEGMTVIPLARIHKVIIAEAVDELIEEEDDGAERVCDHCGREGVRGFRTIRGVTICITKGCRDRYLKNVRANKPK